MYVCTYMEISPGCPLERLMLKLKLQYFGHLMRRADSLEKTLMLGKIKGRRRGDHRGWDGWMASLTQSTWVWVDFGVWWWTGSPGALWFMGSQRVRQDWTELIQLYVCLQLRGAGDTPRPRSGAAPALHWSSREEIPYVQDQEQWLGFAGLAVWRHPTPKVRKTPVRR